MPLLRGSLRRRKTGADGQAVGTRIAASSTPRTLARAATMGARETAAAITVQASYRGHEARRALAETSALARQGTMTTLSMTSALARQSTTAALAAVQAAVSPQTPPISDEEVAEPTPPSMWFTPDLGWSDASCDNASSGLGRPPHMAPTAADEPSLFSSTCEGAVIGELRVELLEAENIPSMDAMSESDAYGLVLLEAAVGRTSAIPNTNSPRWGARSSFRAFRLPVRTPHSVLYIALIDDDGDAANLEGDPFVERGVHRITSAIGRRDQPIGRVAIALASLTSGVEYDSWHRLTYSRIDPPDAKYGLVRLRYSVTFVSERLRLLRYLAARPMVHIVPLHNRTYRRWAAFAQEGAREVDDWDCEVVNKRLAELRTHLATVITGIESLLLWRRGARISAAVVSVLFQLSLSKPSYIPTCLCMLALLVLNRTYKRSRPQPSFWRILSSLAVAHVHTGDASRADPSRGGVPSPPTPEAADVRRYWEHYLHALTGDMTWSGLAELPSFAAEKAKVDEECARQVDEARTRFTTELPYTRICELWAPASSRRRRRSGVLEKTTTEHMARMLTGPLSTLLTPYLSPMQQQLTRCVRRIRGIVRTLQWHDPRWTTVIYVSLVAFGLVALLIPWGALLQWTLRLGGLALFGPHMHLVARRIDQQRRAELEYVAADESGRRAMVEVYRAGRLQQTQSAIARMRRQEEARKEVEGARTPGGASGLGGLFSRCRGGLSGMLGLAPSLFGGQDGRRHGGGFPRDHSPATAEDTPQADAPPGGVPASLQMRRAAYLKACPHNLIVEDERDTRRINYVNHPVEGRSSTRLLVAAAPDCDATATTPLATHTPATPHPATARPATAASAQSEGETDPARTARTAALSHEDDTTLGRELTVEPPIELVAMRRAIRRVEAQVAEGMRPDPRSALDAELEGLGSELDDLLTSAENSPARGTTRVAERVARARASNALNPDARSPTNLRIPSSSSEPPPSAPLPAPPELPELAALTAPDPPTSCASAPSDENGACDERHERESDNEALQDSPPGKMPPGAQAMLEAALGEARLQAEVDRAFGASSSTAFWWTLSSGQAWKDGEKHKPTATGETPPEAAPVHVEPLTVAKSSIPSAPSPDRNHPTRAVLTPFAPPDHPMIRNIQPKQWAP